MKNLRSIIFLSVLLGGFVSCNQPTREEQIQKHFLNEVIKEENINNLMKQGLNEVNSQLKDSTSSLNQAMDTLQQFIKENPGEIESKIQQGLDALNKSF